MKYLLKNIWGAVLCCSVLPVLTAASAEQRFEAENVLVNSEAVQPDTFKSGVWNLWSTDKDAEKKWSGGVVIQGNAVSADCKPGENMPVLKFRIPVAADGIYDLRGAINRSVGVSLDGGKSFRKQDGSGTLIRARKAKAGEAIEFQVAGCYVNTGNPGSPYIDYFTLVASEPSALLRNGGFENSGNSKVPEGWTFWAREADTASAAATTEAKSGKHAARIISAGSRDWAFTAAAIAVKPGETFEAACQVKNNGPEKPAVQLQVSALKGGRVVNFAMASRELKELSSEWREYRLKFTVPEGIERIQLRLIGDGKCDISADDFSLAPLEAEASKTVYQGEGFRNSTPGNVPDGWTPWARSGVEFKAEAVEEGENRAVRLRSKGKADFAFSSKLVQTAVAGRGVRYSCRVKSTGDAPNNATLQLSGFRDRKLVSFDLGSKSLRPMSGQWSEVAAELTVPEGVNGIAFRVIGEGDCDFVVDDFKLEEVAARGGSALPKGIGPRKVGGFAPTRIEEKFDRGLTALPLESGEVYLSWRLLRSDDARIGFDVFSTVGGKERKLNMAPVTQTTDFVVKSPADGAEYCVRPAAGFSGPSGVARVSPNPEERNPFLSYRLSDANAVVNKVGIGDLDGDGRYDFVVRYGSGNVDPWYLFWKPSPKPYVLEAVSGDGKTLWTRSMTWNIESGIWYSPFIVYDVNGDGRAEVILKTADPEAGDLRQPDGDDKGKVMTGAEYLMVLDGMTGREIARAPWPDRRHFEGQNMAYNYFSRNQLAVAYLDGRTPCIVALRGTYGLMLAEAWQLKDGKLEALWSYNSSEHGREYRGQGAHTTRTVDVDGDGRDEVVLGGAVLDDDGTPLWSTGHGHPDYIYVTDITPENPGMEIVSIYETACPSGGGFTCADAKTGRILWELKEPSSHIHYGYGADMDARYRGWEIGGSDTSGGEKKTSAISRHYSPDGELLFSGETAPYQGTEYFAYWDADLQREHVRPILLDFGGGPCGGSFAGKFLMQADLFGDWREELLTAQRGELRIYSTTIPAMDRRVTLMQDPNYRQTVASSAMGYVYDPALSYLPTNGSPNLNLTFRNREQGASLQVVVSAPLDRGLKGNLKLSSDRKLGFGRTGIPIDLKAGGLEVFEVEIERPFPPVALIRGELALEDGTILRGQVPTGVAPPKTIKVSGILTEAEDFVREEGGKVVIRSDKSGVHGKCFSHWDKEGHAVVWNLKVPKSGKFQIAVRYAATEDVRRRVFVDGQDCGVLEFPGTGGFGDGASDWELGKLERGGGQLTFELKEGNAEFKLVNAGGSMNVDYIELIPVTKK